MTGRPDEHGRAPKQGAGRGRASDRVLAPPARGACADRDAQPLVTDSITDPARPAGPLIRLVGDPGLLADRGAGSAGSGWRRYDGPRTP
jgi:hypothetical protein